MKVSDLIQILEKMPKEATVIVSVFAGYNTGFEKSEADEVVFDDKTNTVTIC